MKIEIFPRSVADNFKPEDRTVAIRIWESDLKPYPLNFSSEFIDILDVVFDDISVDKENTLKGISDKNTSDILDFMNNRKGDIETLIINCHAGISRSPAIALALDEVYYLQGLDHEEFLGNGKYSCFNRFVYHKIINQYHKRIK